MGILSFIQNRLNSFLTPFKRKLGIWVNQRWHDFPFGRDVFASREEYIRLFKEAKTVIYEEIDEYEEITGFSIEREWVHELALHTQIVIKHSPICYAHGRVVYSALSSYLVENPPESPPGKITILETGTARGVSSLCMAKALKDQKRSGLILTFDVLPHRTPMYWNCIDDLDGALSRSELLKPWQDLLKDFVIFHQGDTHVELSKVNTERINFAFLDGGHTYDDLIFEFDQIKDFQQIGDMVVFDDYTPQKFPGLVKAVNEICQNYHYNRTYLKANEVRGYVVAVKE